MLEIIIPVVFVVFVIAMIIVSVAQQSIKQKNSQETQRAPQQPRQTSAPSALNDSQKKYLSSLKEKQADKHVKHQADAHSHAHLGQEEHYEEIVGSLGDINDEGCSDLNGVRFIAHDLAYELKDGEQADYNKLAQAIVMGEILNNPRFKHPYGKK